jgi:cytochrome P450
MGQHQRGRPGLIQLRNLDADSNKIALGGADKSAMVIALKQNIAGVEVQQMNAQTSGITLTYFMWRMSQRPDLQKRLREELLNLSPQLFCPIAPRNGEKQGNVRIPSSKAIDSLPLLDATLRETLRLHPAAPGPQPRVTPFSHTPTSINGYANIPGGVKVSSSAYTLHRNLEVYPNPTEWLPERWLEPEPGKIENMRRLFWAFGSGGRMCIGNNFALQSNAVIPPYFSKE